MKDRSIGQFNDVFITIHVRVLPYLHDRETPQEIHDSVSVFTNEVKNHGGGLLIVLQEVTSTLAYLGTTVFTINTLVVPLPFGSTPIDMQVQFFYSCTMSP